MNIDDVNINDCEESSLYFSNRSAIAAVAAININYQYLDQIRCYVRFRKHRMN